MDAASGLDYSHRLKDREGRDLGIVHRDVSPDNLLVGFSGQVKLVDFGIAKAATPALMAAATTAGTVKGKHGYIAPEYLLGQPLDGRADVFALGVVLYRALTGKRPFVGATEAAISMAVVSDPPRPPLEVMPSLNPALAAVALMALEKEPEKRFESARAMRQAIEVAVGHAAENEEVAEMMNELWPAGDEERVALHTLSSGMSEESSSPVLRSVVSGTYSSMVPNVEQPTKVIAPPPGVLLPPPSFDTAEVPAPSRKWLVGLAVVLVAGLGVLFKSRQARQQSHLSVVTPVMVKVFEGQQELGASPLEVDLLPGAHTLRLINKDQRVDQTVVINCAAGQTCSVRSLAK